MSTNAFERVASYTKQSALNAADVLRCDSVAPDCTMYKIDGPPTGMAPIDGIVRDALLTVERVPGIEPSHGQILFFRDKDTEHSGVTLAMLAHAALFDMYKSRTPGVSVVVTDSDHTRGMYENALGLTYKGETHEGEAILTGATDDITTKAVRTLNKSAIQRDLLLSAEQV